ncbi:histidine phosphatase family protein [Caulobacter sp. KR2-114]|uniref:histidine phosphatase family protein n=1 Tax=Caulobacter sp. KR2-114 TaxID=3400912 RepID=UPI003C072DDF
MSRLVLVKHAMPAIDEGRPSKLWPISEEGRGAAGRLAERLRPLALTRVAASTEPKAADTGRVIAERLGAPISFDEGLVETYRETVGWLPRGEVEAAIEGLLRRPAELVYGEETGDAAHARFDAAIARAVAGRESHTVAVAAHGTVIALWVSRRLGIDPMSLWRSLSLPSAVVVDGQAHEIMSADP